MTDKIESNENHDSRAGYEKRDINAVKVLILGAIGAVVIIILLVIMYQYFASSSRKMVEDVVLKPQSVAIRELRARETEELNSYKLLDAEKGIYRIPIDRAMQLIADEAYQERKSN